MIFSSAKKAFFLHSIKVSPNTCPKNTERTPTMRKIHCKRTFRLVFRIKNLEIFNRTSLKVPLELQFIENTTCFISLSNTCFSLRYQYVQFIIAPVIEKINPKQRLFQINTGNLSENISCLPSIPLYIQFIRRIPAGTVVATRPGASLLD